MKNRILLVFVMCTFFLANAQLKTVTPKTNEGPERNPLKGWNSGWNSNAPETTLGFQYISWSRLEPQDDVFDWEAVEKVLNRRGSKGKHLIIRFYADWNHKRLDTPDWLYKKGVKLRRKGESMSTDYNSPIFVAEAIEAIQALGKRYDNDPRLAMVQIGTIGFWGEWHNHPVSEWRPSKDTKQKIVDAYKKYFKNALLLGRYPTDDILAKTPDIGFHNDSFLPSQFKRFDQVIGNNNFHLKGPIGGEQGGGISKKVQDEIFLTPKGVEMIETGHYTFMKPSTGDYKNTKNWKYLNKKMGYNYELNSIEYTDQTKADVTVKINGKNKGVAPAYFKWKVQFGVLDNTGKELHRETLDTDITKWKPGQKFAINHKFSATLPTGNYQLAVRIIQPRADLNKNKPWGLAARNTYMEFSNTMKVTKATWGSKNQLQGGWTIIGGINFSNNNPTPKPPKPITTGIVSGATYRIIAKHSNKYVEISNGSKNQGARVQQWSANGKEWQQWVLTDMGNGYYSFRSLHSKFYLDVKDKSKSKGTSIQVRGNTASGQLHRQFKLIDKGDGYYNIQARHSGYCLDVEDSSSANGAGIAQWACSNNANKLFRLEKVDGVKGVNDDSNEIISYPNPIQDNMTVAGLEQGDAIKIFNLLGKEVYTKEAQSSQEVIDMESFPSGFYLLSVSGVSKKFTTQLVKE